MMRTLTGLFLLCAAVYGLYRVGTNPYRAALPLDAAELPALEPALARLPEDERTLVREYLERSNLDVLPAGFADPDAPLTARTIGEAIPLQRDFREKMAAHKARMNARSAEREARMQPLREAVAVRMLRHERVPKDELMQHPGEPTRDADQRYAKRASVGHGTNVPHTEVMTFRVSNRTSRAIAGFKGRAEIPSGGLMPLAHCWIDQAEPLAALDSRELRCANPNQTVAARGPPLPTAGLIWYPEEVRYADGEVLRAPRD